MDTRAKGILLTVLSALLFGVTPVLASRTYELGSNAITTTFYREVLVMPVLLAVLLIRRTSLRVSRRQLLCLLLCKAGAALSAQPPVLKFFLQPDKGGILPIVAEPKFFPPVYPAYLFPQSTVIGRIKIQACHPVAPVLPRVAVPLKQLSQPSGQHQGFFRAYQVLLLMAHGGGLRLP